MKRYSPATVEAMVRKIAIASGVSEEDAGLFSSALIAADLQGTKTHGLSRLGIYIRRIQEGVIHPNAPLTTYGETGAVFTFDAGNGLGQVQAQKALDILESRARRFGVAIGTICNSQHFGMLSYYGAKIARQNMILLSSTNCEPAMSPTGGCDPVFGTNPIAASFPTSQDYSINIDLATSTTARGNIIMADKEGKSIPLGWALDPDGNPTTNPKEALQGSVLTMAGHKGYALALMVELLSGVLSGASIAPNVGSMYKDLSQKQNVGHFFCLIDIAAFMPVHVFKSRVALLIANIKNSRKQHGISEINIPGERSYHRMVENRKYGFPISDNTLDEMKKIASEFNIAWDINPIN